MRSHPVPACCNRPTLAAQPRSGWAPPGRPAVLPAEGSALRDPPRAARFSLIAIALGVLASCVTVNVYFPAAAAQKAADKIINAVTGTGSAAQAQPASHSGSGSPSTQPPTAAAAGRSGPSLLASTAGRILGILVPAAQAAEPANLDISTPQIRAIVADMHQRFARLKPYFQSGVVGITATGKIAVRDQSTVPLMQRARLAQLVAAQNRDLSQLYEEIAEANGHPQWAADIGSTFASRWISHAKQSGWYYRNSSGEWVKG